MKQKFIKIIFYGLILANILVLHLFLNTFWDKYKITFERFCSMFDTPHVKIFITYYKPYVLPEKGVIFEPIQVGRAVEREPFAGGRLSDEDIKWLHAHMIGDDTGDNISAKNRFFDVLTAYYWVWKHYKEIGNPHYVGFFAHRKQLLLGEFNPELADYGYKEEEIIRILKKHKIVYAPMAIARQNDVLPLSLYSSYEINHHIEDFDALLRIIKRHFPEMYAVAEDIAFDDKHVYGAWNFWVMEKNLAFDYFEKLFLVMFELEKDIGDEVQKRDLYQRRAFGFLAERFFAVWLEYQKRQNHIVPYKAEHYVWDL